MAKLAATNANAVNSATSHGAAVGFAGLGSAGDSDDTTLVPNTRTSKGNPTGTTSFAGSDNT